ncbi:MAG: hypothetical protein STSR0008_18360 [Ignavibacterium sp.]
MDSSIVFHTLKDTLRIINVSQQSYTLAPEYIALISVVLGALLANGGNILLAKYRARTEIQKSFFDKRLDVYIKISELNWQTYHVTQKVEESNDCFPTAYTTFKNLIEWNNNISQHIDRNRFLIDQITYRAFDKLNNLALSSINQLKSLNLQDEELDKKSRELGREKCSEVQKLSEEFIDSARKYINENLKGKKIKIEKVV